MAGKPKQLYDLIALRQEAAGHEIRWVMWPTRWKGYRGPAALTWTPFPFDAAKRNSIPNKKGVYAFVVRPSIAQLELGALMYIGKAEKQTLRERFGQYLLEVQSATGRPKVVTMLGMYEKHVHFYCAEVRHPLRISKVEDFLIESLLPPMNEQYPVSVRRVMKAFS